MLKKFLTASIVIDFIHDKPGHHLQTVNAQERADLFSNAGEDVDSRVARRGWHHLVDAQLAREKMNLLTEFRGKFDRRTFDMVLPNLTCQKFTK